MILFSTIKACLNVKGFSLPVNNLNYSTSTYNLSQFFQCDKFSLASNVLCCHLLNGYRVDLGFLDGDWSGCSVAYLALTCYFEILGIGNNYWLLNN